MGNSQSVAQLDSNGESVTVEQQRLVELTAQKCDRYETPLTVCDAVTVAEFPCDCERLFRKRRRHRIVGEIGGNAREGI